jgi:hypothetical protein
MKNFNLMSWDVVQWLSEILRGLYSPLLSMVTCLSLFSVAVTKYLRLGNLQRSLFLSVLEAGKSRSMVPATGEGLLAT